MSSIKKLIQKLKNNKVCTFNDFQKLVQDSLNENASDKDLKNFLLTVKEVGLKDVEVYSLFDASYQSSKQLDTSFVSKYKVDKHSTGGVGDKTTMLMITLLNYFGLSYLKLSGSTLGHTGGTSDKMRAFKGFKLNYSATELKATFLKNKKIIANAAPEMFSFESKSYKMRNQTDTVYVIELIVVSIFIKKLLIKSDFLVIDIKFGFGSLFDNLEALKKFAHLSKNICDRYKINYQFIFSNMNQPLGAMIGNKNEVVEVIKTLDGEGSQDVIDLTCALTATALVNAGIAKNNEEAINKIKKVLKEKKAIGSFREIVEEQGGDWLSVYDNQTLKTKYKIEVTSPNDGFVFIPNNLKIGNFLNLINNFYVTKNPDLNAGIHWISKNNKAVKKGDVVYVYYTNIKPTDLFKKEESKLFVVNKTTTKVQDLFYYDLSKIKEWNKK